MDQTQKDKLVEEFQQISQVAQKNTAIFYLESTHWELDSALAQYFESTEHPEIPDISPPAPSHPATSVSPLPSSQPPQQTHQPIQARPQPTQAPKPTTAARRSGVRTGPVTLNDVKGREDDEEEDVQNYYTGGEKSGMMVQDPQPKKGRDSFVKGLFQAARESGAEVADESMLEDRPAQRQNLFAGGGYRLGDTPGPSYSMNETRSASNEAVQPQGRFKVKLTLWKNGFTLNDGPLRPFDDPEAPAFFQKLYNQEIPQEIREMAPGQEIDLFMVDHRHEDAPAPTKPKVAAFAGAGHVLGGELPPPITTTVSSTPAPTTFTLDESKPITSIQIRLHDGTRMVARFNHHHTIQDIRGFIDRSRSGPPRPYILRSGFPAKVLEPEQNSQTLAEAGLLNAVVVQSFS